MLNNEVTIKPVIRGSKKFTKTEEKQPALSTIYARYRRARTIT